MSFKTILVPVTADPTSDAAVRAAVDVANMFDGVLLAIGAQAFMPPAAAQFAYVDADTMQVYRDQLEKDLDAAEVRCRSLAGATPFTWRRAADFPHNVLATAYRCADLVVASRPPAFTGEADASNYELESAGLGLWQPGQEDVTEAYVARYFEELPGTVEVRQGWMLADTAYYYFPTTAVTAETVSLAEELVDRPGLDASLRRVVVDAADVLRRRLAVKELG